ncbi:MAG: amidase [Spirochaetia bacterium]|nr:amidase [Spirochaetia bacterium]
MSIAELSPLIRKGEISPIQVVTSCLERIEHFNPILNAFITVLAKEAVQAAQEAEKEIQAGNWRGPLHGIPVGVKDMFDTAGIRTTAAFKHFAKRIPKKDAQAVTLLKEAGAIIIGKTNMHELAMGTTSAVSHFGAVCNPWNQDYVAGGSSGGSAAAVASGMCYATLDTDAVGSCRLPAACCGVVGFKPGYGLIPTIGILDGEPVDDVILALAHAAFMTGSADDACILLDALSPDGKYKDSMPKSAKLKIGIVNHFQASEEVRQGFEQALKILRPGFETVAVDVPMDFRPMDISNITADRARIGDLVFSQCDVLVLPTTAEATPTLAAAIAAGPLAISAANTYFCNYYGLPSISIPCTPTHLPLGLQIVGPKGGEQQILKVAIEFQKSVVPVHPNLAGLSKK